MFKCKTKLAKEGVLDLQGVFFFFFLNSHNKSVHLADQLITSFLKGEILLHPHRNTLHRKGKEATCHYLDDCDIRLGQTILMHEVNSHINQLYFVCLCPITL